MCTYIYTLYFGILSYGTYIIPVTVAEGVVLAPLDVLKLTRCGCATDQPCATARCTCATAQLSCTILCGCNRMKECCNRWTKTASTTEEDKNSDVYDVSVVMTDSSAWFCIYWVQIETELMYIRFYSTVTLLAERCISHSNSVCLSICPSITCWYPIQTNEDRIMRSSLWCSKSTLFFRYQQWLGRRPLPRKISSDTASHSVWCQKPQPSHFSTFWLLSTRVSSLSVTLNVFLSALSPCVRFLSFFYRFYALCTSTDVTRSCSYLVYTGKDQLSK